MARRLRPVRRAPILHHAPSSRTTSVAGPRRIMMLLLLVAVFYTVHWTSSDYWESELEKGKQQGIDSALDKIWKKSNHDRNDVTPLSVADNQDTKDSPAKIDNQFDDPDGMDDDNENGAMKSSEKSKPAEAAANKDDNGQPVSDIDDAKHHHRVAGLSCDEYGGPSEEDAVREMVYWRDIPSDANFESPLKHETDEQFLTFEPDEGGWNNIRMAFESAVAMAVSMGRTLVLPPKMRMYRLWDGGADEKNVIGFSDFFHFDSIVSEHKALKVITLQEFLEKEALSGRLIDPSTGLPTFPPENRTDWTGAFWNFEQTRQGKGKPLWEWLRNVTTPLERSNDDCVVGFPSRRGKEAADHMSTYLAEVLENDAKEFNGKWPERRQSYIGHPTPVNASAVHRLSEMLGSRPGLCLYDENLQETKVVHAIGETSSGFRLLVHFYAFLFFEDWKQDLWTKRFIRDHFRYIDEINCAAARIVQQVRKKAVEFGNTNVYHSFHVRRGDFQYQLMHISAEEMYANNTRHFIPDGSTVYIATDEGNKTFFDPLRDHYNLLFLDDFRDQVQSINKNYYGMLDQLVASRGEVFWGAFYSTFTGYINRMRGYHAQKESVEKDLNRTGEINSFYYVPKEISGFRERMRTYHSLEPAYWQQEWPVSWRDIDFDVHEEDYDDR